MVGGKRAVPPTVEQMPVRILISDDSEVYRQTLRRLLESVDQWQVTETRDGAEAVSRALEIHPDVVILDLAMPVKDGLTASREISQALPNAPILLCTMHSSPQVELEAKKVGARATISKTNSAAIVPAVQQLLADRATPVTTAPAIEPSIPAILASTVQPATTTTAPSPADPAVIPPDPKSGNDA